MRLLDARINLPDTPAFPIRMACRNASLLWREHAAGLARSPHRLALPWTALRVIAASRRDRIVAKSAPGSVVYARDRKQIPRHWWAASERDFEGLGFQFLQDAGFPAASRRSVSQTARRAVPATRPRRRPSPWDYPRRDVLEAGLNRTRGRLGFGAVGSRLWQRGLGPAFFDRLLRTHPVIMVMALRSSFGFPDGMSDAGDRIRYGTAAWKCDGVILAWICSQTRPHVRSSSAGGQCGSPAQRPLFRGDRLLVGRGVRQAR